MGDSSNVAFTVVIKAAFDVEGFLDVDEHTMDSPAFGAPVRYLKSLTYQPMELAE
jgi:hypothetical protein